MPVYRIDFGYDGTGFKGYARQSGLRTVQGELESAISVVIGADLQTSVAGRTDAGVHARAQVASFSAPGQIDGDELARSLNGILGPEISVHRVTEAEAGFDARFSARWRRYRYQIAVGPSADPLRRHEVWHVSRALDVEAMQAVASAVIGEHDFSSFCRAVEGQTAVRRVDEAVWEEMPGLLTFWIEANAFCHQMVRSLVGLSYDVGRGFTPVTEIGRIIEARDRSGVVTVAPPQGLTLWEVGYPS